MQRPLAGLPESKVRADLQYALSLRQRGQFAESELIYRRILKSNPGHFDATHLLGVALLQRGKIVEGEELLATALRVNPDHVTTLNNRGLALHELGRFDEAVASYNKAIALKSDNPEAFYNRGNTLKVLKRFDEALANYDTATALKPDFADAFNNRGLTLQELRRFEEALASYDKARDLKPNYAEALNNQGNAFQELKRFDEALKTYDKAIAFKPDYADAFYNRGNALKALRRFDEALASYDIASALKPDFVEVLNNRGLTLQELKRYDEALGAYDKALSIRPDLESAWLGRGNIFFTLKRDIEALAAYDTALSIKPDSENAWLGRGNVFTDLKRYGDAFAAYDKAFALKPDLPGAEGSRLHAKMFCCIWSDLEAERESLLKSIRLGRPNSDPFVLLSIGASPEDQLRCANIWVKKDFIVPAHHNPRAKQKEIEKIRIAYLSADFRQHPVADLMADLFAVHDRSRFDVLGISFGPDDKSDMRSRLIRTFDIFHDARFETDDDVAKLLHGLKVDIAIDLMGHTRASRPGILFYHPAPIQVSYLGFPGTTGADFIDYVIADKVVVPFDQQPHYSEKIVHLPECYLVNASQRRIADRVPSRLAAGLPQSGFVYCCFNNSYKITADFFDVWMRLLKAVDGSVLWLRRDNEIAEQNLRREAETRGINPTRLVFASRVPLAEDHLARYRIADLFLDTLPYNAHATASDALWVGLPVLTCCGASFAGRVGASLLNAIGLPKLVTYNLQEYEALALQLAQDASLLASIRAELARNRAVYPLFNTKRFTQHLETAYMTMWNIWQRGEAPRSFSVAPIPD